MSLSLTVGFAAAILYGPAFAGIVAIGGVLISDLHHLAPPLDARHLQRRPARPVGRPRGHRLPQLLAVPGPGRPEPRRPGHRRRGRRLSAGQRHAGHRRHQPLRAARSFTSGRPRFARWASSTSPWRRSARCWPSPTRTAAGTCSTSRSSSSSSTTASSCTRTCRARPTTPWCCWPTPSTSATSTPTPHSQRVAEYVGEIARALDLPRKEIDLVVSAARVHDLGKIATDNRILYKQASLTDEERKAIIAHPADGSELAGQFSMYRKGRDYIRHHHERWDGRGYPDGLAGTPHPAGRAHHHRGRRLRRDDLRPALPRGAVARDRPGRAAPRRRPAVRPRSGRDVHRPATAARRSHTWSRFPRRPRSSRAHPRDRRRRRPDRRRCCSGARSPISSGSRCACAWLVVLALALQIVAFSPLGAHFSNTAGHHPAPRLRTPCC